MAQDDALVIDVRDAPEVEKSDKGWRDNISRTLFALCRRERLLDLGNQPLASESNT